MLNQDTASTLYAQLLEYHDTNQGDARNAIRDMRPLFEGIFKTLTVNEERAFSNTYARTLFVMETRKTPREIVDRVHGFRRFANRVVHEEAFPIPKPRYLACLEALATIIHHFSGAAIPEAIATIYAGKVQPFEKPVRPKGDTIAGVRCVVLEIGELKESSSGYPFFKLTCSAEDTDMGTFTLFLWKSELNDLSRLHRLVWPWCTLQIHTLRKDGVVPDTYSSVPETQVILEPDFLIDATDVAECFQWNGTNPYLFFLGKLGGSDAGLAAFQGNLVNDLLDRIIREPGVDSAEVLRKAIHAKALTAARYGQEEIDSVLATIRDIHLPNLRHIAQTYKGKPVRLEPTFVSAAYGLQGRLDALIEDRRQKDLKDIFELKSGKAPNGDQVWINNQVQVVCYHLLLRSVFGDRRHGTSAVFYSAAQAMPLRNVAANAHFEAQVQFVRNMIVRGIFDLARKDLWILNRLQPESIGTVPAFKANTVRSMAEAWQQAGELGQAWYGAYLAFLIRELITAKVGGPGDDERIGNGFASLWLDERKEKERRFQILDGLQLIDYDESSGMITLSYPPALHHNFREGDIGIIYQANDLFLDPLHQQILKGDLTSLGRSQLTFRLRNRQIDPDTFKPGTTWVIEHDFYESGLWTQVGLLQTFLRAPDAFRDLIFGQRAPRVGDFPFTPDPEMDPHQNDLLRKAMQASDYFLLQGPPGTGKTSTMLTGMVTNTLAHTRANIVILAFTNRAVNEICNKLRSRDIPFLYLGHRGADEDVSVQGLAEDATINELRQAIATHRVMVSTSAGFAAKMRDLEAITRFDVLMVDEASQLTEPALAGILSGFKKFILIGDQNQLPAVVAQPEERCRITEGPLAGVGYRTLSESLFGRMYRRCVAEGWDHAIGMLETHFRMHDRVARLINPFYGHRLVSGKDRQRAPFEVFDATSSDPVEALLSRSRTLFIPTELKASNKTNREEADKVVRILATIRRVYGHRFHADTVGVVTPWRAQIALIRSLIDDETLRDQVLIDTVERFQGLEKKHIIASLAIYSPSQLASLQSLDPEEKVDRKLVVTLSRAEEQIILLGYEPALRHSPLYREVLEGMG